MVKLNHLTIRTNELKIGLTFDKEDRDYVLSTFDCLKEKDTYYQIKVNGDQWELFYITYNNKSLDEGPQIGLYLNDRDDLIYKNVQALLDQINNEASAFKKLKS